jgi:hypothetical protein
MKRSRFTEEQIIAVLKEHELGAKTADLCRKHGISEATLCGCRPRSKRLFADERSDRVRSCVRPLMCGLSSAAGQDGDLRIGSKSSTRAQGSVGRSGFPGPDLVDRCAHSGRRLLTPPSPVSDVSHLHRSCSGSQRRIPVILALRQHGPDCAGHLVRQRDRDQHLRLALQHPCQPRACGDGFLPEPIDP